jgi:hypothetical protein
VVVVNVPATGNIICGAFSLVPTILLILAIVSGVSANPVDKSIDDACSFPE